MVVQVGNEEIYGTASRGDNNAWPGGCGTVYKMTPSGWDNRTGQFQPKRDGLQPG
jgi:hypothetical protein